MNMKALLLCVLCLFAGELCVAKDSHGTVQEEQSIVMPGDRVTVKAGGMFFRLPIPAEKYEAWRRTDPARAEKYLWLMHETQDVRPPRQGEKVKVTQTLRGTAEVKAKDGAWWVMAKYLKRRK